MPDLDLAMGDSRHKAQVNSLIRLKGHYNGAIMVSHLRADITLDDLNSEIKDMCSFQVRRNAFTGRNCVIEISVIQKDTFRSFCGGTWPFIISRKLG